MALMIRDSPFGLNPPPHVVPPEWHEAPMPVMVEGRRGVGRANRVSSEEYFNVHGSLNLQNRTNKAVPFCETHGTDITPKKFQPLLPGYRRANDTVAENPLRCWRGIVASVLALMVGFAMNLPHAFGDNANDDLSTALEALQRAEQLDATLLREQWRVVAKADRSDLSKILDAINRADALGANWLTMAVDAVLERDASSDAQTRETLTGFIVDSSNAPIARKTALAALQRIDRAAANELAVQLIDDPVAEFRRPGVAARIAKAAQLAEAGAATAEQLEAYREALNFARDADQVNEIAKAMESAGAPVKLADHFGFIQHWQISGPFDNTKGAGFDQAYPPELLDLKSGKLPSQLPRSDGDSPAEWKSFAADEDTGNVDLNKAISPVEQGIAYGLAQFDYQGDGEVELRFQVQNSFKCWLNGELIYAQPIGHTGNFFDQYRVPVKLNQGSNVLLIKSCQTEPLQDIDWFKVWQFAVRVSDSTGAAIDFTQHPTMTTN